MKNDREEESFITFKVFKIRRQHQTVTQSISSIPLVVYVSRHASRQKKRGCIYVMCSKASFKPQNYLQSEAFKIYMNTTSDGNSISALISSFPPFFSSLVLSSPTSRQITPIRQLYRHPDHVNSPQENEIPPHV